MPITCCLKQQGFVSTTTPVVYLLNQLDILFVFIYLLIINLFILLLFFHFFPLCFDFQLSTFQKTRTKRFLEEKTEVCLMFKMIMIEFFTNASDKMFQSQNEFGVYSSPKILMLIIATLSLALYWCILKPEPLSFP